MILQLSNIYIIDIMINYLESNLIASRVFSVLIHFKLRGLFKKSILLFIFQFK